MNTYNEKHYDDKNLYCDNCERIITEKEIEDNHVFVDRWGSEDGIEATVYCLKCWAMLEYDLIENKCEGCGHYGIEPLCWDCIEGYN